MKQLEPGWEEAMRVEVAVVAVVEVVVVGWWWWLWWWWWWLMVSMVALQSCPGE